MQDFVNKSFRSKKFRDTDELLADWVKLVSRCCRLGIYFRKTKIPRPSEWLITKRKRIALLPV